MNKYKGYYYTLGIDGRNQVFASVSSPFRAKAQGESVKIAIAAMEDKIDLYLAECEKEGVPPPRQFSGAISLRVSQEEHLELYRASQRDGSRNLSEWMRGTLLAATSTHGSPAAGPGVDLIPHAAPFPVVDGIPDLPYVPHELPQHPVDAALFLIRSQFPNRSKKEVELWRLIEDMGRTVTLMFNAAVTAPLFSPAYTQEELGEQFSLLRETYEIEIPEEMDASCASMPQIDELLVPTDEAASDAEAIAPPSAEFFEPVEARPTTEATDWESW